MCYTACLYVYAMCWLVYSYANNCQLCFVQSWHFLVEVLVYAVYKMANILFAVFEFSVEFGSNWQTTCDLIKLLI